MSWNPQQRARLALRPLPFGSSHTVNSQGPERAWTEEWLAHTFRPSQIGVCGNKSTLLLGLLPLTGTGVSHTDYKCGVVESGAGGPGKGME